MYVIARAVFTHTSVEGQEIWGVLVSTGGQLSGGDKLDVTRGPSDAAGRGLGGLWSLSVMAGCVFFEKNTQSKAKTICSLALG